MNKKDFSSKFAGMDEIEKLYNELKAEVEKASKESSDKDVKTNCKDTRSEKESKGKITTNRNRKGEIISYRFRICVGREEGTRRQIWRTTTIKRPENLTPKAEEKEVNRLFGEWEKQQKDTYKKDPVVHDKSRTTFHEFVTQHWLVDHVKTNDHTPSSQRFYEYAIQPALVFFGEKKRIRDISTEEIKRFINFLNNKETYGATTVKHCYGALKNVMRYARRTHYIDENPFEDITRNEAPHRQKHEIDFLRPQEARRFLECLENEPLYWKVLFTLMLKTGARRGEVCGLRWIDLNEKELTLSIVRNVTLDKNAENGLHVGEPKMGESRILPISAELSSLLTEFREIQRAKYKEREEKSKQEGNEVDENQKFSMFSFVFCNEENPNRPIRPDSVTTKLRRFTKKNGIRPISPHDLRHSAASLSLAVGADLKQIQRILGHADPETTMRFYAEITEEAQRETADKLEALLSIKNA